MIALLQRVTSASVSVNGERVAEIGHGGYATWFFTRG